MFINPMLWKRLKLARVCCVAVASSILCLLSHGSFAASAPPLNDACSAAEVIPGGAPFPRFSSITPDVSAATIVGDAPAPTDCYPGTISRSIWYQFTPTASGFYVLSVDDTETTVPDTLMGLYTSAGGCAGPFVKYACNDDAFGSINPRQSAIGTNLTANTPYYIVVWVVDPFVGGSVQMKISKPSVPTNDVCSGAEVISATVPSASSTNDVYFATATSDPPVSDCGAPGLRSVWFRFTPTTTASYKFSTCRPKVTWINDTLMALYSATTACGTLTKVACDDNGCGFQSTLTASLTSGTIYYVVVWDLEPGEPVAGETALQVGVSRLLPPTVTTLAASSITSTSVVLKAAANPNTAITGGWFEWGTNTSYGNTNFAQSLGSSVFDVAYQQTLTGLVPRTLYHYRAVATNSVGRATGVDRTFVWTTNRPSLAITRRSDGINRIRFTGSTGEVYKVDGSSNLPGWTELGQANDPAGNGSFEYFDTKAQVAPRTLYRVRGP